MNADGDTGLAQRGQQGEGAARTTRPLRIVMVNDEPLILDAVEMMIRFDQKDVVIIRFQSAVEALRELLRTEPDLLITDDMMPWLKGHDMVRFLLLRKVTYPIVVVSNWSETDKWVSDFANQGFDIASLPLPCTVDDLRRLLSRHFSLESTTTQSQP